MTLPSRPIKLMPGRQNADASWPSRVQRPYAELDDLHRSLIARREPVVSRSTATASATSSALRTASSRMRTCPILRPAAGRCLP